MNVIVAGSRTFNDYRLLRNKLDQILANKLPDIVIVSGGARGADTLGERYAQEKGLPVKQFPADWDTSTANEPAICATKRWRAMPTPWWPSGTGRRKAPVI